MNQLEISQEQIINNQQQPMVINAGSQNESIQLEGREQPSEQQLYNSIITQDPNQSNATNEHNQAVDEAISQNQQDIQANNIAEQSFQLHDERPVINGDVASSDRSEINNAENLFNQ